MGNTKKRIAVGMSGGVDSSVAAALLLEDGYDVTGLMLRLWVDDEESAENRCCSPDSVSMARKVAGSLGIPFYVFDAREEFRSIVVDYFINGYRAGETPNPCVVCNKWVRWGFLRNKAELMGLEYFATGHYARIDKMDENFTIKKGIDLTKDQSYVLSRLTQNDLSRTILPLGTWHKTDTRKKAENLGLPVSRRADSQDLCFTQRGPSAFLHKYLPEMFETGEIVNQEGVIIGSHHGLADYTIGQRKGIRIANSQPLYVVEKDYRKNQLVVGSAESTERDAFRIRDINWIIPPTSDAIPGEVMVRYRSKSMPARILIDNARISGKVITNEPIRNITPGQLAVIYQGEDVIGSGFITNVA